MKPVRSVVFLGFCFAIILVAGCAKGPTLHPVKGVVTIDGAPLKGGPRCYVIYVPDPSKGNESPHEPKSTIDENGRYSIETVDKVGATAGWYKVRVEAAKVVDPDNPYFTDRLAPEKYGNAKTSGLEIEVKEGGTYDLKLNSK